MKAFTLFTAGTAVLIASVAIAADESAQRVTIKPQARLPDVIFVPTPQPVVNKMLKLANVQPGEMVYDLGCGDGRAVITAARDFGARGIGVDIDPRRIEESRANAQEAGVTGRVEFKQEDLFTIDFKDANVVFLYLLPSLNLKLRPRILEELRPGTRIVSHSFSMGDWKPDRTEKESSAVIYYWVVPAQVAGEWQITLPDGKQGTLDLSQQFQEVGGTLRIGEKSIPLTDLRLEGDSLSFSFGTGEQSGSAALKISGTKLAGDVRRGRSKGKPESWSGERTKHALAGSMPSQ